MMLKSYSFLVRKDPYKINMIKYLKYKFMYLIDQIHGDNELKKISRHLLQKIYNRLCNYDELKEISGDDIKIKNMIEKLIQEYNKDPIDNITITGESPDITLEEYVRYWDYYFGDINAEDIILTGSDIYEKIGIEEDVKDIKNSNDIKYKLNLNKFKELVKEIHEKEKLRYDNHKDIGSYIILDEIKKYPSKFFYKSQQ